MSKAIASLCLLFCSFLSIGQERDSVVHQHSPRRAAIYSLIIPGAGQVYNHLAMPKGKKKAYWKIPIFYSIIGFTGYRLYQSEQTRVLLRREILARRAGAAPNYLPNYTEYALSSEYKTQRSKRDRMIMAFAASYGLCVLDAFVEAHFVDFDVSKDLTLKIRPQFSPYSTGITAQLKFR